VLETLKERETIQQITSRFGSPPEQDQPVQTPIHRRVEIVFEGGPTKALKHSEQVEEMLYKKIGHLQVQLDFLKKTSARATDNGFIERLWLSVKVEDVHIKPAKGGIELYQCLAAYLNFYNHQRPDQPLKFETPAVRFGA
jgi:hypothetical protein